MFLDPFDNLTDQEAKKKVDEFFNNLEYLEKIRKLLKYYPKYNITKLEQKNIFKMWKAIPLEAKKGIVKYQWKYGK